MDMQSYVNQLACNAGTIGALTQGVTSDQARWRPSPGDWSILEVINHLLDEEVEDFRAHLDAILHHPDRPWALIDPQGWVTARQYNERDLGQSVGNFLQAREASLAWLKRLHHPDWTAKKAAPWGSISAGDIFVSWIAHDLLHMRQLVELHRSFTISQLQPYSVQYAGPW